MIGQTNYVTIGGIKTACASRQDLVDMMEADTGGQRRSARLMFDINGHGLALSLLEKSYRQDLDAADIVHADGEPLVMASRWMTKSPVPERSATTDLFHDMAASAERSGKKFFLLGGTKDVVDACAQRMQELYPALAIVGARDGYFAESEEQAVCEEINASGADIVWVGLGKPKEQAFCVRNRDAIAAGWLVTCGGCFNYVTGHYPRAPEWMQKTGTEWLHRMFTQPRKLAWRYISTTPLALFLLFTRTGEDLSSAKAK